MSEIPSRVNNATLAREQFGELADHLFHHLTTTDALADAAAIALMNTGHAQRAAWIDAASQGRRPADAPPELLRLVDAMRKTPPWLDRRRMERGRKAIVRPGLLTGYALIYRSLVMSYLQAAGNKPLAFSGRLEQQATRRIYETASFVVDVCQGRGPLPGTRAFSTVVAVRILHASLRVKLEKSPRWNTPAWGRPINESDMAGTQLLFSLSLIDGVEALGARVSEEDREALIHFWTYLGFLLGVPDRLNPRSYTEARRLWDLLWLTTGEPDGDSRALAHALILADLTITQTRAERALARQRHAFLYELSRALIGDANADKLNFPRSRRWRTAVQLLRRGISVSGPIYKLPFSGPLRPVGIRMARFLVDLGVDAQHPHTHGAAGARSTRLSPFHALFGATREHAAPSAPEAPRP